MLATAGGAARSDRKSTRTNRPSKLPPGGLEGFRVPPGAHRAGSWDQGFEPLPKAVVVDGLSFPGSMAWVDELLSVFQVGRGEQLAQFG